MLGMSKRILRDRDARRAAILEAAKSAFSRYGFGRTSMADIADLARISRPALYTHFRNKEDLFRSLAETLVGDALERAEAAWPAEAPFSRGLADAVMAMHLELFRLVQLSPHGAEILAQQTLLTGDLHAEMQVKFAALVASRAGGVANPDQFGLIAARAMEGLKQNSASETEFVEGVERLAEILGTGLASVRTAKT